MTVNFNIESEMNIASFDNEFAWDLINGLGQGIVVLSRNGRFDYANHSFKHLIGNEHASLIGLPFHHLILPQDHSQVSQAIKTLEQGKSITFEARLLQDNGSIVYTKIVGTPRLENGRVIGSYHAISDITESKNINTLDLSDSESQLAGVINSALDAIITTNKNQEIILFNHAAEEMFACCAKEAIGKTIHDFVPHQFRAKHKHHIEQFGKTGSTRRTMGNLNTLWALRANGEEFPIEASISQQTINQQTLYTVILRDITERKKVEKQLRENEQKYTTIFDNSPFAMILAQSSTGVIVNVNDSFLTLSEFSRAEVIGKNIIELGQTNTNLPQNLLERLKKQVSITDFEITAFTKCGNQKYLSLTIKWVTINDEKHLLTTIRDITDHKLTIMALQESEERLRLFIEHAPASLAMFDKNMRYIAVSRRWQAEYDLKREHIIGCSHYDFFPEISDEWKEIHQRGLNGEVISSNKDCFVRPNGDVNWLRWEVRPWYRANNDLGGIVIFTEDITKRINTERELRELQNILAEAETVAQIGSWKWDLKTQKVTWSSEMYNLFGIDRTSFDGDLNKLIQQRIHPDDIDAVNNSNISVLENSAPAPLEYRIVLPDGTERIVWGEGKLTYSPSGEPLALVGYVQDITMRVQAEKALRQSEAQLQYIIDTVPEGVMLLRSDGRVQRTNPVAEQYLETLSPEWENGRLISLGNQPLNTFYTSPQKGLWHEININNHVFETIARPVEVSPEISGWVLVLRDITQERDIQHRIYQQERLAAVGQLAAGIAHDFNNIMAVITLYAELIGRTVQMPNKAKSKLTTIEKQAQQATNLIQQILDFSRQSVLERQVLDLLPYTKELVKLLERTLSETMIINLQYEPDTDYIIQADPSRIQQMILNLAVNARDASPEGGPLNIKLDYIVAGNGYHHVLPALPSGNWIEISISDQGSGIPKETLPQIFEPFFTTKEVGKGTGLGLAQVYGIVQQHDGYIDVQTDVGHGTTFSIYFPAVGHNKMPLASSSEDCLQMGQNQSILLVEDDPSTREALIDSLIFLNYQVIEAKNGREALHLLTSKEDEIAMVVSDVVMPEMGGVALLHAMRHQGITKPLILLTGHPLNKELDDLQNLDLTGWLSKPPNIVPLSQLLANSLKSA